MKILPSLVAALVLAIAPVAGAADIGDPKRGEKLWNRCQSCHQVGVDAQNKVGPHLNELFGRVAGALDGFRFSKAMAAAGEDGLEWHPDTLDAFLAKPRRVVPKTRMAFAGIADAEDRADLIAFLRAYSANPQDIPESDPTAAPRDPDVDPAILAIAGDPAYGEYLASECTTCHQASGADMGMPSITGWPTEAFVIVMHAYKTKHRAHPVMQMMAARLSDEEIAALAAYFEGVE